MKYKYLLLSLIFGYVGMWKVAGNLRVSVRLYTTEIQNIEISIYNLFYVF